MGLIAYDNIRGQSSAVARIPLESPDHLGLQPLNSLQPAEPEGAISATESNPVDVPRAGGALANHQSEKIIVTDVTTTSTIKCRTQSIERSENYIRPDCTQEQDNIDSKLDMAERLNAPANDNITIDHDREAITTSNNHWFTARGQVITIANDAAGELPSRSMVVMANTVEGALQCVSLCFHGTITDERHEGFCKSHVPVATNTGRQNGRNDQYKTRVQLRLNDGCRLRPSSWINCQHVWTIRQGTKWNNDGSVENFQDLLEVFKDVQKDLYAV